MRESKRGYNYVDPCLLMRTTATSSRRRSWGKRSRRGLEGYWPIEVLCRDARAAFLLRPGCRFGKSKSTTLDRSGWTDEAPAATGELDKLCAVDADGSCTFPSSVTLAEDLTCDGAQCDVHTLRVVEVADAAQTFYYQWVPNACADLAFTNDPTILRATKSGKRDKNSQCGDPLTANGIIACCDDESDDGKPVTRVWAYPGERTTFSNAQQRCASMGKTLCAAWTTKQDTGVDFRRWLRGWATAPFKCRSTEGSLIHSGEDYDGETLQPATVGIDSTRETYRGFFAPISQSVPMT